MLGPAQPDLINPVRRLAWLNAYRMVPGMFQHDGNRVIRITCPAVEPNRVNIQLISHPFTFGAGPDLIVHLYPDRIRITAVYIGFTS